MILGRAARVGVPACCLMKFNFLVSSVLLCLCTAVHAQDVSDPNDVDPEAEDSSAQKDTPTDDDRPPVEEIIVHGEMEIARKRSKVIQNLQHLGYREAVRRDGRSIMRPSVPYRPTIVVDDDAWMHVKRSPVRVDPPGKKDNKLRYLWCLPPFTITAACIQIGGQVIAERKLAHFKDDIARATDFEMRQWRKAVIAHAMDKRLGEEIPDMLDRMWEHGQAVLDAELLLEDWADRRGAILEFWSNRACTAEGPAARFVTADFITEIIQNSAHPAPPSEILKANHDQRCSNAHPLPVPASTGP